MESVCHFLQSCRLLRRYNLTMTQAQVICALGNDRVTAADIQCKTGLSESAVMSCLAYLQVTEDVEIERLAIVEGSKKKVRVYVLSDRGQELFKRIFDLPGDKRVKKARKFGEEQLVLSFSV